MIEDADASYFIILAEAISEHKSSTGFPCPAGFECHLNFRPSFPDWADGFEVRKALQIP